MASLLELGVSTGKWDSGLKKAQSALNSFTQSQGGLQQALDKENQKIGQFVQMMGKMESTAKTAKGQMSDYKGSIEQLSAAYNRMTDAQRQTIGQNYLQAIDAMKKKFQEAKQSVDDLNRSLNDTGNAKMPDIGGGLGGLFGGGKLDGMLQVFGGNLMTKGAGMLAGFASEMQDLIQQGIELAKQGEGIRIAFERLNKPGLLDNLREATHGTVTDIELMKSAVKFNDFKLPVEELGTMLAFAQQKAKDTGQSIDYMVDSIVTGLGRKSLMILDNLGLSAAEIKDKMAETGDMTKAVGAIIREQMQQAGDYVETAADRATQADVELKNAMEELGRTFQPLTESGTNMFNALKVGAINALNALRPYIDALTTAGRARQAYEKQGGNTEVEKQVGRLKVIQANGNQTYLNRTYNNQLADYDKQINDLQSQINNGGKKPGAGSGESRDIRWLQGQLDAIRQMRDEYVAAAKEVMNPVTPKIDTSSAVKSVDDLKVKLIELEAQRKKAIQAGDRDQIKNLTQQINQTKQDIKGLDPTALAASTTRKTGKSLINLPAPGMDVGGLVFNGYDTTQSMNEMQAMLQTYQKALKDATTQAEYEAATEGIARMKELIEAQPIALKMGVSAETVVSWREEAQKRMDEIKPITIGVVVDGKGSGVLSNGKKLASEWQGVATAIQAVAGAMAQIEDPAAKVLGTVAQAIATVALSYAQALSMAAQTGGPWGWIAFAATGLATMVSSINAIKTATAGSYAEGGIVPGNNHSDGLIAHVSSGELILNRAQQDTLAAELTQGSGSGEGLSGQPFVTGDKIFLGINNSLKAQGKGEIVTTSMLRRMGIG